MSKAIRVENADTNPDGVTCEIWETFGNYAPDVFVVAHHLDHSSALQEIVLNDNQYIIIRTKVAELQAVDPVSQLNQVMASLPKPERDPDSQEAKDLANFEIPEKPNRASGTIITGAGKQAIAIAQAEITKEGPK